MITAQLAEWAVKHRRYLHAHPELSGQEFETCRYLKEQLEAMGLELLNYEEPNIVALLRGTIGEKTIALRADIDALPIQEENNMPYASKVPGVGHMCGHDGHTAILLAVAKYLSKHRGEVKHNILFIFQSSEEMPPSGAEKLVQEGVTDEFDVIFGLHLMSAVPKGLFGMCHGPMMASSDDFDIFIQGQGGHGSSPHETIDPTYIAGHLLIALQSIISRRINPIEPAVLSVGQVKAGSNYNIIADHAYINGTFRTFSEENRQFIMKELTLLATTLAASFGATAEVKFIPGTPPVVNDLEVSAFMEEVIKKVYGEERFALIPKVMGSEDFAFYVEKKQGAYILVGMGGEKSAYPHHHPKFDIDEEEIATAIDLFLQLVHHYE